MQSSSPRIIAKIENGIGWLIFNNPEKHNAISHDMRIASIEIMESFASNGDVRAVMMRGAGGKAFISGADISQFESAEKGDSNRWHETQTGEKFRQALEDFPKPLIAVIEGYCLGGGMMVAMSVDIRIASADSQFGIPAARLGIAYPVDGVRNLVNLAGPAKAREILLTGKRFDAQEALRIGLVNQVYDRTDMNGEVEALASSLRENAPLSMRATRIVIKELLKDESARSLETCEEVIRLCYTSEDFAEGRKAFAEKRRPVFKGV
ncbi:MAG: enoyl-CoA hydratase [Alphaproteobacteria bacterium]|nr:enoyl-CoA hydratase [Alphaproteobacteria bacterium]